MLTSVNGSTNGSGNGGPAERSAGVLGGAFGNRWFVACLVLLAVFTAGFEVLAARMRIQFRKADLPLRRVLDDLDKTKLRPYEQIQPVTIQPDVLDQLGTRQCIQWVMKDASPGRGDQPEDIITLFVTYYTGDPDQVPHVPEQCYLGVGHEIVEDELLEVTIPGLGAGVKIPVHLLVFERSAMFGRQKSVVLYTFHVNGQFRATRGDARLLLADPRDKHAYFSKVELTFGFGNNLPEVEKALAAGERFLQKVIPVLVQDHWPDWVKAENSADGK